MCSLLHVVNISKENHHVNHMVFQNLYVMVRLQQVLSVLEGDLG